MDTHSPSPSPSTDNRTKLNIGGKLYETTSATLQSAGLSSLLTTTNHTIFIDRDPDIFSPLLSLLRTQRLPSTALRHFSLDHLLSESNFYKLNIQNSSFLYPPPFSPFDASFTTSLIPPSSAVISSFSAASTTFPIILAHLGQISFYHPTTLSLYCTLRTHFDDISAVDSISPEIAAAGSYSSSGVHLYSRETKGHVGSLYWVDDTDTRVAKSRVTAVADSVSESVFSAAFECKHGENAVLIIDKSTLKVVSEIGRQSGNSAKSSAIKRLRWVPRGGLLVGSSVNCGAFGYSGYVRVWDTRSGEMVWDTSEPGGVIRSSRMGDSMADVDVDPDGLFLAKMGSKTGDLGVADLRMLRPDPWLYLKDLNPSLSGNWKAGMSVVVHCYEGNVFVGRDGELEAWSRLGDREVVWDRGGGDLREWDVYRRNFVDKVEDAERGIIRKIEGGGNRLFVCRENVEGVEVWETSHCSGGRAVL